MGQFLKDYKPPPVSLNATLNNLLTRPVTFYPSAIITQEVNFPDVSFYQEEIDFSIMSQYTKAIILRIGQGEWIDEQFERNYREAKRYGLLVGGYWFFDGRTSPGKQADILTTMLRGKKLELEVYVDWERNYGGGHEGLGNVVAMMQSVESKGLDIKDVGLYTGYYFFRANSNPITNASHYNYLKNKRLWLAWYTGNPADVLIPAPWNRLHLWQWGTPVLNWGQKTKEIDMNTFNGTRKEFEDLYGVNSPEEPEEPMNYVELKSNTSVGRSVREQTNYPQVPHIIGTKVGTLLAGQVAKALPEDKYTYTSNAIYNGSVYAQTGDVWWKVYEVNGSAVENVWIAERHMGQSLLVVTPKSDEPAPALPTLIVEVSDTEGLYTPVSVELKPK